MEITVTQILEARDARVRRQAELLHRFGRPLICFTMNIAGPVKNSPLISRGFGYGKFLLEAQLKGESLPILHQEQVCAPTGCEGYWVVDAPAMRLKSLTAEIEDSLPVGRLFDMDVLDADGRKLERSELGLEGRKCLLCEAPAAVCGRSRAHSVEQLQERTRQLLEETLRKLDAQKIGQTAVRSLLYEVCATPKPGLVDRADSGSHKDMDIFTFMDSAAALQPYFTQCAAIGIATAEADPRVTFGKLRFPGKVAEAAMKEATGGVNTHKGAIFSLGILCAAAGRLGFVSADALLAECAAMTKGISDEVNTAAPRTTGEHLTVSHGIRGVRGQAEAGFPAVKEVGLPILRQGLAQGLSLNDAGCAALLHLMQAAEDTNLLHRGGLNLYHQVKDALDGLLSRVPFPTAPTLQIWNESFVDSSLSPGGSADLLALTYFLLFLEKEI